MTAVQPAVDQTLRAVARGLALFPLPAGGRVPAAGWQQLCTTDPTAVRAMAVAGNVGVGCRASDVVALDLDRHQDGQDGARSFAAVLAEHDASWPSTLTVRTPSGGLHVYFRAGGRLLPSNSSGRSGLGAGVDTRGPGRQWGGYLVGPGSVVAGGGYVLEKDLPILDLPPWLADVLATPRPG